MLCMQLAKTANSQAQREEIERGEKREHGREMHELSFMGSVQISSCETVGNLHLFGTG